MLFWEALNASNSHHRLESRHERTLTLRAQRLPYDRRCTALTKSGSRCRGRVREGAEFCPFHDPALTAERRRRIASKGGRNHHRLSHIPDGYLRKLKSRAAVGEAMDRLYREVRLGIVSAEMGAVLFNILTRLLDSGLVESGPCPQRTRAARIKPKLSALLTREERAAWQKAVSNDTVSSLNRKPVCESGATFQRSAISYRLSATTISSG